MASTFSTDLKIELMATGENSGTWGTKTNTNLNLVQQAIVGFENIAITSTNTTLLMTDATISSARNAVLRFTGTITANCTVFVASGIEKTYILENATSGAFTLALNQVGGASAIFGTTDKSSKLVYLNGTDVVDLGIVNLTAPQTLTNKTLTSPKIGTSILDTNGNELALLTATASAVNEITLANAATGNSPTISATGGDTNVGINLTPKGTGGIVLPAGAVGTPALTTSGDLNTGIFFPSADTIAFTEGGAEAMRITSDGKVGIGTTTLSTVSPAPILQVAGNLNIGTGNSDPFDEVYINATQASGTNENGSALVINGGLSTGSGLGGAVILRAGIDGSGSGTTQRSVSVNGFSIDFNSQDAGALNNAAYNSMKFCFGTPSQANKGGFTGGTRQIVTIDGSDNGTGGTTLEIIGASNGENADQGQIIFYGSSSKNPYARIASSTQGATYNSGKLELYNRASGTEYIGLRIDGAGKPFFPNHSTTGSSANAFLETNGELKRSTSSIRYKTNVEDLWKENSDAILNLRPVWYRSLCEFDNDKWSWYGLIAEEVAEIDPRLVHWTYPDEAYNIIPAYIDETSTQISEQRILKDDAKMIPDGVQYERIAVLSLDIIKRQNKKIEQLEARLTALES